MMAEARRSATYPPPDSNLAPDLVTRAVAGDQQAWDALVDQYAPLIWSVCRRYELTSADAQDVSQHVWLLLFEKLDQLRDPAALPGWLVTVTRRECLRAVRGPGPARGLPDDQAFADEHAQPVDQDLLTAERHAALREAVQLLPAAGQQLIALLLADPPLSYAEIGAQLNLAIGSIGPYRRRLLDRIRRHPAVAALLDPGR